MIFMEIVIAQYHQCPHKYPQNQTPGAAGIPFQADTGTGVLFLSTLIDMSR